MDKQTQEAADRNFDVVLGSEVFFTDYLDQVIPMRTVDNKHVLERTQFLTLEILELAQRRFNKCPHADNYKLMEKASLAYQNTMMNIRVRKGEQDNG